MGKTGSDMDVNVSVDLVSSSSCGVRSQNPNLSPKITFLENALIIEIELGVRNKFLFSKLMVQLVIWST